MINSAVRLLDITAERYPEKIAVWDDDCSITYAQYKNEAQKAASSIIKNFDKLEKNRTIAIFLPKGIKVLISFMAVLYSGNTYIPLDTSMPESRLKKIFSNLCPDKVITSPELKDNLMCCGVEAESILIYDELFNGETNIEAIGQVLSTVTDLDPIYIMYTSGSTGMPKGVVIPHRGVIDYAQWVCHTFGVDDTSILGNQSPFYFDNTVLDIYASLRSGAKLVIINEAYFQFQAKLPEFLNQEKINFIFWVPTVYINIANSGILEEIELPFLKKALFCGEVMPNKQLNIWRKYHPQIQYANLYGPTEITDVCTYYIIDREFEDDDSLPIGKPCENMDIIILTDENKQAAVNEVGELCVLGSGLALGYYKEKELTEKAFTQNPTNNKYQERIYKTGDLAFINDEGLIIFIGRKDSQIKHRGNRIELGEIENAARALPDVKNACVLHDEKKDQIVMFLEASPELSLRSVKKNMLEMVPKYMLPGRIEVMEQFPYTPNSKIDRVFIKNNYL